MENLRKKIVEREWKRAETLLSKYIKSIAGKHLSITLAQHHH